MRRVLRQISLTVFSVFHMLMAIILCFSLKVADVSLTESDHLVPWRLTSHTFYRKDVSGYGILPHTESSETVTVCMCHLPKDHALSPYGTASMRPNDAKKRCLGAGNPLFPSDEFEVETRVGGKPNSLMAFVKTPTSWHSLPPLPNLPYARHYLSLAARKSQSHI